MESLKLNSSSARQSKLDQGAPRRLIFSSFCALLTALSFGYTIGFSSPAIPQMEVKGIVNNRELGSLFGSLLPIGALVGSFVGGYVIDKYGRKKSLIAIGVPYAVGWLFICDATGVILVMCGRFLTGVASGMVTVVCPVYVAEISTRTLRGTLGSGTQLFITIGIMLAYVCGMYMSYVTMATLGLVVAFASSVIMTLAPETPRWYLMKDRKREALMSLSVLRQPHADVEDECRDLEDGIEDDKPLAWRELISKPQLYQPLKISIALMLFQQMSGINAIMFYSESIFKAAGYTKASEATVMIGVTQVFATMVACYLMDRAGRRLLLIIAGMVMACTCFSFACYYYSVSIFTGTSSISWLAVTSLVLYIVGFSLGWGPIPMLLMSEIFPSKARGRASAITVSFNWMAAFIVSAMFMTVQDLITPAGTFVLFGISCLSSIVYVWKFVPETKGKSLEDIELYFSGKNFHNEML